jgi:hypothetical protein
MSERTERPLDRIAPDDLPEQVDAEVETVDDAVAYLHRQGESTTPDEEQPKCNVCLSKRVRSKPTDGAAHNAKDGEWVCTDCRHHFDDPVYDDPEDAFRWVGEDVGARLVDPPIDRQLAQLDDRALTALAIYLYRPWEDAGPSYRDLEEIWPYARNWIGDRVREWKAGEHRDLVADPRPPLDGVGE